MKKMRKWNVDLAYSEYITVEVEAKNEAEAVEKAEAKAETIIEAAPDIYRSLERWSDDDLVEEVE